MPSQSVRRISFVLLLLLFASIVICSSSTTNSSTLSSAPTDESAAPDDDDDQPHQPHLLVHHRSARVWGPGLRPDLSVLPARYFHIQARHADGSAYTEPLPSPYTVHIEGHLRGVRSAACPAHVQQFDRGDGSVLVRYKMPAASFCTAFAIRIAYAGQPVGASPYRLPGGQGVRVRGSQCRCPRELGRWLRENNCVSTAAVQRQIDVDLRPFGTVNVTHMRANVVQRFAGTPQAARSVAMCHYVVHGQRLLRRCYGEHTGFKMFVDAVLVALLQQVRLPDFELFANLGDWPLVHRRRRSSGAAAAAAGGGGAGMQATGAAAEGATKKRENRGTTELGTGDPLPVFSWCGSADSLDIVWPTYDLTESALQSMGRVLLDMQSVQQQRWPWREKRPQAFWRGRDSRRERLRLVELAREAAVADMFNVSLTNFFFFRDEEERFGPRAAHISFMDFFEYRWQINIDGTVAAYRLPYLLGGDSLVLKQQSNFYEHFYAELQPWRHFVPLAADLGDVVERVRWARDHEPEVRRIVARAQQFARDNLQADHVLCYHVQLLKKWSAKLVGLGRVDATMDAVEIPSDDCECDTSDGLHDEL